MNRQHSVLCIAYPLVCILMTIAALWSPSVHAGRLCFTEAGMRYNIDPLLLRSIGIVESNLNKQAIGVNRDAAGNILSRDYGIMQINQIHIPQLIKKGIIQHSDELLSDPCLNIKIGASILSQHFGMCGINWHCLGTYNAGFSKQSKQKRLVYAKKIYVTYTQLVRLNEERIKEISTE